MRRIIQILIVAGLCYLGWHWLRAPFIRFVCQDDYRKTMTSAGQEEETAWKVDAMRGKAEAAYQSCLEEWGLVESDESEE